MREMIIWAFVVLVIGWMIGYGHHYLAMKKNPRKMMVMVITGNQVYESELEARKAYRALKALGVNVKWEAEDRMAGR